MSPALIVCGLNAEVKTLSRAFANATRHQALRGAARDIPRPRFVVGGGDQGGLARHLAGAADSAPCLISLGIAGGLAHGLRPGDIRVASRIIAPSGGVLQPDRRWTETLAARLKAPTADFVGVDQPVMDPEGKAALHRETGADLVDMESYIVAQAAAAYGRPFAAVRVVSDSAERALPHAAAVSMRPDGGIDLPAILRSIAGNPAQVVGLIRTGLDARKAFAGLFRCGQLLGPGLAFLDLGEPLLNVT